MLPPKSGTGQHRDAALFDFSERESPAHSKLVLAELGLKGDHAVLYELRHAAASGDLLANRGPAIEILLRGQSASLTRQKTYARPGPPQKALARRSPCQHAYARVAHSNLQARLEQILPAEPPPYM